MDSERTKKAILVVDDEPRAVKLLRVRLAAEGYRVVTASDGDEALEKIRQEKPGLILLDIMMPKMDGMKTLKKIKQLNPDIPVAMVTAVWDEDEAKKAFDEGAYEYITKPIDMNRLKLAVLVKLFPNE